MEIGLGILTFGTLDREAAVAGYPEIRAVGGRHRRVHQGKSVISRLRRAVSRAARPALGKANRLIA